MWKLLSTILLLSSLVYGKSISDKVEDFLNEKFSENSRFKSIKIDVADVVPLKEVKGWNAYILDIKAYLKSNPKRVIEQRMVWFSNGTVITKNLIDMDTGLDLTEFVRPHFQNKYYKKENLLFGDLNAKHKIVIFSDPLCPFCRSFVPRALKDLKKDPKKFVVYYFHLPLERLHPASKTLVQAAIAAELKGYKDVVEKLYSVKVDYREKNVEKILEAFNKAEGTNITKKDIKTVAVKKQLKEDLKIANHLMVNGTPTLFFDGKIDKSKKKYLKVK